MRSAVLAWSIVTSALVLAHAQDDTALELVSAADIWAGEISPLETSRVREIYETLDQPMPHDRPRGIAPDILTELSETAIHALEHLANP